MNADTQLPRQERDLRLDFIRGLALFIIFIDHSTPRGLQNFKWLSRYTLHRFSFIDGADVFVFLSGYVAGMVYTRRFLANGLASCFRAAARRCLELYLAEVSLFVMLLAVVNLAAVGTASLPAELHSFRDTPLLSAFHVLTLRSQLSLLDLLPLYIVFLALTPLAIVLAFNHRTLLIGMMMASYVAVHAAGYLHLGRIPIWSFNPFAWQLVFFGALLLGHQKVRSPNWWAQSYSWLTWLAAGGLTLIALVRIAPTEPVASLLHSHVLVDMIPRTIAYADKRSMEPLRLLNLVLWVIVIAAVNPGARFLRHRIATWPIICGQHSLIVFWVGAVLNYLGAVLVIMPGTGRVMDLIWAVGGCLALVGTGFLCKRFPVWERGAGQECTRG